MSNNSDLTIFSLVSNPCTADSRVLKQAGALASAGYRVRIYARAADKVPDREVVDGIEFVRFDCFKAFRNVNTPLRAEVLDVFGPEKNKIESLLQEMSAYKNVVYDLKYKIYVRIKKHFYSRLVNLLGRNKKPSTTTNKITDKAKLKAIESRFYLRYFDYAENLMSLDFDTAPDIIHAHDLYTLPAAIALGRKFKVKVIYDAHEIETERVPPLTKEKKDFIASMEASLLTEVDRMVTVCDSAADFYYEIFKKSKPLVVMNSPEFSETIDYGEDCDVRKMAGLSDDDKVLIYTGGIGTEARGLDKVVEALAKLPDMHMVVLGPRHITYDKWLKNAAIRSKVQDRVHMLKPVPPEHVVAAIRTCDVGICPIQDATLSYRFAMPNKLFEMAFAEIPICVSDLPEMSKFVEKLGVGMIMDQTSPSSIAETVRAVLKDREKFVITQENRDVLQSEYSWPIQADKLLGLYKNIAMGG
ncbi:glycosyltransferase family 4 protein [Deltaproteobacteria bacterium IMCC39524]|nr:glycosyltransferase family 4 protein [Deltaproteobacteria bacterium IMCC39524]